MNLLRFRYSDPVTDFGQNCWGGWTPDRWHPDRRLQIPVCI